MVLVARAADPDALGCWLAVGTGLALVGLLFSLSRSTAVAHLAVLAVSALALEAPAPLQQLSALAPGPCSTLLSQNGLMTKSTAARPAFPPAWKVGAQELAAT